MLMYLLLHRFAKNMYNSSIQCIFVYQQRKNQTNGRRHPEGGPYNLPFH